MLFLMEPSISFSTLGTCEGLQWHCIWNISVSTTGCWWLALLIFYGKTKILPWPPDYTRLWLGVHAKHCSRSCALKRWALREDTGIPREIRDIWRQKGSATDFTSDSHCLEGKQLYRTHSTASQKNCRDKVKVSRCSSLTEEKDWIYLFLRFLQNLRSSDTSIHTFMQSDI